MSFFKNEIDTVPTDIPTNIWETPIQDIDGNDRKLSDFAEGKKAIVFVNVACKCGLTSSNYTELVDLYNNYKDKGLQILGFPCGQFMDQELDTGDEIKKFVDEKFKVEFPMTSKITVNGEETHPIFKYLKYHSALKTDEGLKNIPWNFSKFLVDSNGKVINYYLPTIKPSEMKSDIEALL